MIIVYDVILNPDGREEYYHDHCPTCECASCYKFLCTLPVWKMDSLTNEYQSTIKQFNPGVMWKYEEFVAENIQNADDHIVLLCIYQELVKCKRFNDEIKNNLLKNIQLQL